MLSTTSRRSWRGGSLSNSATATLRRKASATAKDGASRRAIWRDPTRRCHPPLRLPPRETLLIERVSPFPVSPKNRSTRHLRRHRGKLVHFVRLRCPSRSTTRDPEKPRVLSRAFLNRIEPNRSRTIFERAR